MSELCGNSLQIKIYCTWLPVIEKLKKLSAAKVLRYYNFAKCMYMLRRIGQDAQLGATRFRLPRVGKLSNGAGKRVFSNVLRDIPSRIESLAECCLHVTHLPCVTPFGTASDAGVSLAICISRSGPHLWSAGTETAMQSAVSRSGIERVPISLHLLTSPSYVSYSFSARLPSRNKYCATLIYIPRALRSRRGEEEGEGKKELSPPIVRRSQ